MKYLSLTFCLGGYLTSITSTMIIFYLTNNYIFIGIIMFISYKYYELISEEINDLD